MNFIDRTARLYNFFWDCYSEAEGCGFWGCCTPRVPFSDIETMVEYDPERPGDYYMQIADYRNEDYPWYRWDISIDDGLEELGMVRGVGFVPHWMAGPEWEY